MTFALDAYLARVAMPARPTLDAEGLARLQRAQRLAIPFENLDVALGRGIAIDSDAVFAKLVLARRGGYCFEQNRLFLDALTALGFDARPLLARVWLRSDGGMPRLTHMALLVTTDGKPWIADAGFGGDAFPPLPLEDGAEADAPGGARYSLSADDELGWVFSRRAPQREGADAAFEREYSFTLDTVDEAALAESNRWTATSPDSRFTRHRIVSIALPNGLATLTDCDYRRIVGDTETTAEIIDPRVYRIRLSLMFGIDLSAEDIARLGLFAPIDAVPAG